MQPLEAEKQPARKWGPQPYKYGTEVTANGLNEPRSSFSPQSPQIRAQADCTLSFFGFGRPGVEKTAETTNCSPREQ